MIVVNIEQVIVPPDRQRQAFNDGKVKELVESIYNVGLLHPPVVQPMPDGQYVLRAGEYRHRAISKISEAARIFFCDGIMIEAGQIPVTRTTEMSDVQLLELEFDENIKRQNLTPQEEVKALARILAARRLADPEATNKDVATEISKTTNTPVGTVVEKLAHADLVVQHMNDPRIAKKMEGARSVREMYAIASSMVLNDFQTAARKQIGTITDHECHNDDCLKVLPTLKADWFDCIIADPPYGMGADSFGTAGPSHEYKDTEEYGLEIAACILREGFRVSKANAHLYMFCDIDLFHRLRDGAAKCGWTPFRTPLIWDKGGGAGHNPIPSQAIRRSYEMILFAYKGDRPALKMITDVVRDISNVRQSIHAAEKPGRLYEHLLSRSCKPGDWVLDPTCGVGPVFEAANILKCRAFGIEKDKQFFEYASQRRFGSLERPEGDEDVSTPADPADAAASL